MGPNRLPFSIDFNTYCYHISEALNNYSSKWCRRKHADFDALLEWKKYIMDIIDTRISIYKSNNNHILPRKPRFNYLFLIKGIPFFIHIYMYTVLFLQTTRLMMLLLYDDYIMLTF